jgi:hypothetical protein
LGAFAGSAYCGTSRTTGPLTGGAAGCTGCSAFWAGFGGLPNCPIGPKTTAIPSTTTATIAPKMPAIRSESISIIPARVLPSADLIRPVSSCEDRLWASRTGASSPYPEIERVRLLLLISGAVGFPDQRKTSRLVEAARRPVLLECPQLQPVERGLRDPQQRGTPCPCAAGTT